MKVEISHKDAALANPKKDGEYIITLNKTEDLYCRDIGVSMPSVGFMYIFKKKKTLAPYA